MSKKSNKVTVEAVAVEAVENKAVLTAEQQTAFEALPTTSSKIRFLDSAGVERKTIAKMLNKRYQHVRNVLITPIKNEKK